MALESAFDRLWPIYCSDLDFDGTLEAELAVAPAEMTADSVEALVVHALDRQCSEGNVHGVSLAAILLTRLAGSAADQGAVAGALARLCDPDVLEDLKLDCPAVEDHLALLESALGRGPRRLRVLAVRNGLSPTSETVRALRGAVDLRIPGSPHIAATGNEDAQGKGEREMADILRQHLQRHAVDLVLVQSRGCRLVVEYLISGARPYWSGPVLALSPAGDAGRALAASLHPGSVLLAASSNDLPGGTHPVLQHSDITAMASAAAMQPARRELVFEEAGRDSWAGVVAELVQRTVAKSAAEWAEGSDARR